MNDIQNFVRDNWKTILCEANSRLDKVLSQSIFQLPKNFLLNAIFWALLFIEKYDATVHLANRIRTSQIFTQ